MTLLTALEPANDGLIASNANRVGKFALLLHDLKNVLRKIILDLIEASLRVDDCNTHTPISIRSLAFYLLLQDDVFLLVVVDLLNLMFAV
jgi:hypothetical protein